MRSEAIPALNPDPWKHASGRGKSAVLGIPGRQVSQRGAPATFHAIFTHPRMVRNVQQEARFRMRHTWEQNSSRIGQARRRVQAGELALFRAESRSGATAEMAPRWPQSDPSATPRPAGTLKNRKKQQQDTHFGGGACRHRPRTCVPLQFPSGFGGSLSHGTAGRCLRIGKTCSGRAVCMGACPTRLRRSPRNMLPAARFLQFRRIVGRTLAASGQFPGSKRRKWTASLPTRNRAPAARSGLRMPAIDWFWGHQMQFRMILNQINAQVLLRQNSLPAAAFCPFSAIARLIFVPSGVTSRVKCDTGCEK